MYYGDYVKETSTTTGTGNITLAGASTGHQTFASVVPVGDPFEYSIIDANGTGREIGIGTMLTSTTFSRDTVLTSTNSNAAITLSSGTHTILMTPSAEALNKRGVMADTMIDYVQAGLVVPTTSGSLTGSISAGVAYVVGQRVVKGAQSRAYTASKDTYVDLSNKGVLTYVEVTNGAAAPAVTVNSMRIGKVVTGASTISSGTDLRNLIYTPACVLRATTGLGQAAPNVAATAISFPSASYELTNNVQMHSASSNPSRITAVVAGLYSFKASIAFDVTTSSKVVGYFSIRVNGSTDLTNVSRADLTNGDSAQISTSADRYLNVGDYVEAIIVPADQTGSNTQFIQAGSLSAIRVG